MSRKFLGFLSFIVFLCLARPLFMPEKKAYLFLIWNLFLAAIPYGLSLKGRHKRRSDWQSLSRLGLWLLFFPNAPYIITDLVHLNHSEGFDWYDTILILSAGIAGLKFAFDSLEIMVGDLGERFPQIPAWTWRSLFLSLSALGVYLGRYLRFNSWDILSQPLSIVTSILQLFRHPFQHQQEWSMILIFSLFLYLLKAMWPTELQRH